MLQTHPLAAQAKLLLDTLVECIDACFESEGVCTSCADACLGETADLDHLQRCIRLNADCADLRRCPGQSRM